MICCVRVALGGGDALQIAHTAELFGKFCGGQPVHPVQQRRPHELLTAKDCLWQQRKQAAVVMLAGKRIGPVVGQALVQLPRRDVAADGELTVPAQAREVFDVSGAGDTVIAVTAAMLAAGADLQEAVRIANRAGGIVVGKLGTASVSYKELFEGEQ